MGRPTAEGGCAVFWRDVTARVRAEAAPAALAAERERLRALVRHMLAPVALLEGPEHRFALVNAAYRRVSGGGRDVTGLTPFPSSPGAASTSCTTGCTRPASRGTGPRRGTASTATARA